MLGEKKKKKQTVQTHAKTQSDDDLKNSGEINWILIAFLLLCWNAKGFAINLQVDTTESRLNDYIC